MDHYLLNALYRHELLGMLTPEQEHEIMKKVRFLVGKEGVKQSEIVAAKAYVGYKDEEAYEQPKSEAFDKYAHHFGFKG